METGFFATISKKVISAVIAVGSMFYSTIDGVTPELVITEMLFVNDRVIISADMSNCFTEELEQILASGNEIPLHFDVELYKNKSKEPDSTFTINHVLHHSPLSNNYTIYFSERSEYIYGLNREQAKTLFTNLIDAPLFSANELSDDKQYFIKITAWLDKIKLKGMDEELNLIYYWNSIKPSVTTPLFIKSNFQS